MSHSDLQGLTKIGQATVAPTKDFFVRMLTRDIELRDALLDLLDNCVDGILRTINAPIGEQPYAGFWAKITLCGDYFLIEDNCGGIPKETAEKYAFSMGATLQPDKPTAIPTVGMYGIGMKRAIFKLGTEALVESRHDVGFTVEFSSKWMADESWTPLPMLSLNDTALTENGTRITVFELHEESRAAFSDTAWIDEFRTTISQHYALIIAKGFSVRVGSSKKDTDEREPIGLIPFRLLQTEPMPDGTRIQPYSYFGRVNDVDIEIYAGLYRRLMTEEESDVEEQTRGSTDEAGWSISCNDRIVVWKDKTRLTGWGEASVPNYHGQFIAITGIVLLRSDDPKKLPLTTTKHGIDASLELYSVVKDLMREATKSLTTFTNKWKKNEKKLDSIYVASQYVELPDLRKSLAATATSSMRKYPTLKKSDVRLPIPSNDATTAVVRFTAEKEDIELLGKHFFGEQNVKRGEIGEAAFNDCLTRAKA